MSTEEVGKKHCAVFIDEENIRLWLINNKKMHDTKAINDYLKLEDFFGYLNKKGFTMSIAKCYINTSHKHLLNKFDRINMYLYSYGIHIVPTIAHERKDGYEKKSLLDPIMIVDCLSVAHQQKHIKAFFIFSGDKDFYPLALELIKMGKQVIFIGGIDSAADLIKNNPKLFEFEDIMQFINEEVINR